MKCCKQKSVIWYWDRRQFQQTITDCRVIKSFSVLYRVAINQNCCHGDLFTCTTRLTSSPCNLPPPPNLTLNQPPTTTTTTLYTFLRNNCIVRLPKNNGLFIPAFTLDPTTKKLKTGQGWEDLHTSEIHL